MAYEPRPGDASLFENDSSNERAPHWKGYIVAHRDIKAGEKVSLAMWKRNGARGTFLSGKVSDQFATAKSPDGDVPF
jgi:hypothetical protein